METKNSKLTSLVMAPWLLGASSATLAATGDTNNMFGSWTSVTLTGNLGSLSSNLKNFDWLILNQVRTREDTVQRGSRVSEDLLFAQMGYKLTPNASIWLGYTHDWLHLSVTSSSFQESRPYEDFLWKPKFGDFSFTSRTRLEQRINQESGDVGVRARQLFQVSYPLSFLMTGLSVYANDEVMAYLNKNTFGKHGFTENRAAGGLSYQYDKSLGFDLGYLGQYVQKQPGPGENLYTHNLQFNIRYGF